MSRPVFLIAPFQCSPVSPHLKSIFHIHIYVCGHQLFVSQGFVETSTMQIPMFLWLLNLFAIFTLCPSLKLLDFSLDGDWESDSNGIYTHASLQKENFPSSFTICLAFMVEEWGDSNTSPLFLLLDSDDNEWMSLGLFAAEGHTEFTIQFSSAGIKSKSPHILFPM